MVVLSSQMTLASGGGEPLSEGLSLCWTYAVGLSHLSSLKPPFASACIFMQSKRSLGFVVGRTMGVSTREGAGTGGMPDGAAPGLPVGPGVAPNVMAMGVIQAVTVIVALILDRLGFPEEALIVLFVLGVLLTAIATDGRAYSMVASLIAVLTFNYFIVEPRLSLRAWGPSYPETFMVMFAVAAMASHLVARQREGARALMEASLMAQHEQLRSSLLRSVSHDLRTPLTSISGKADLLATEGELLDAVSRRQIATDIREDAVWLTDVVENILSMTRLEEGGVQLDLRPEDVGDVIDEALGHVRRDMGGHEVVVERPEGMVLARMDARVVMQVVVNLVNNALSHTPDGSRVTISWRRVGDLVRVSVADDGPGVPEGERGRVFEPFFTSSKGLSDGRRGIGLGLSLCKVIVEAHGGSIWVDPVLPHGASFSFTLPAEEVPEDG